MTPPVQTFRRPEDAKEPASLVGPGNVFGPVTGSPSSTGTHTIISSGIGRSCRLVSLVISAVSGTPADTWTSDNVDVTAILADSKGTFKAVLARGMLGLNATTDVLGGSGSFPMESTDQFIVIVDALVLQAGAAHVVTVSVSGTVAPEDGSAPKWSFIEPASPLNPLPVGLMPRDASGNPLGASVGNPVLVGPATNPLVVNPGTGIFAVSWGGVGGLNSSFNAGTVVAPANGAAIVQIAGLAAGTYVVSFFIGYGGTAGNVNGFSVGIVGGSAPVAIPAAINFMAPPYVTVIVLGAAQTLTVNANGAGPAGSVYVAAIVATRIK